MCGCWKEILAVCNFYIKVNQGRQCTLSSCKSNKRFRCCRDIVERLDMSGSTERTHTRGIGSRDHEQSVPNVYSKQRAELGPYSFIYHSTSAETSTWSIITELSNYRFKRRLVWTFTSFWCCLRSATSLLKLFKVQTKFKCLRKKWGSLGHPSRPTLLMAMALGWANR